VLEAFDTPNRVVCVARRDTTNTPLHALVLLNGVQFVEAARVLAERLLQESGGTGEAFLRTAFARLSGRAADPKEREILGRMYAEQQQHYRQHPADAASLVALGDTPRNTATDPVVLAAATTVVNALMNHDTFVVKR
jgi:cytochrome c-type biogenesis protein CcmH/NrfG